METLTLSVKDFNVNAVMRALQRSRGVQDVDVDLVENIATVTFDETEVTSETLRRVVAGTKHESN
ncbi:heavy-metal-associated domain-containing protein [Alicyclobacillus pomorum]|uniref:heavy-metal-associated domain-containing protein n=1 Tax=Alicyclobacillus pomorum TaxID=204470 RepID=UPI00040198A3|nr:heavy-metal-associated domain-containing protein [Alicyclobacillus pomorum]